MSDNNNLPMSSPDTRSSKAPNPSFPTLGIAPFVFGAHDEEHDWHDTRCALRGLPERTIAIGLCYGSGIILHRDDQSITAFAQRKAPPVILDGDFNAALPLDTRITFTHDGKGRVLTREVGTRDHGGGGGGGARVISADIPVVDAREHLDSLD